MNINNDDISAPTPIAVAHAHAHAQHSMSACDKLTMETMMNVEAYSKYMNRRIQAAGLRGSTDASERKFYRRRIIDTTKEMLRDSKYVNDCTVSSAFNAYVSACIMHFKFIDLADTIQDEYSELSVKIGFSAAKADNPEDAAESVMKMNKLCFNPKVEEAKTVKIRTPHMNAIERLFVSKPKQPETEQLDKNGTIAAGCAEESDGPLSLHLSAPLLLPPNVSAVPRTKDINIKDAQFKTKGIKSKLKNKTDKVDPPDPTAYA